jgi:hypothetical protein
MTIQIRRSAAIDTQQSGLGVAGDTASIQAVSASGLNNPGDETLSTRRDCGRLLTESRARLRLANTKLKSVTTAEMGATVGYSVIANRRESGLRRSSGTNCDSAVPQFTWVGFNRFGESAFSLGATSPTTAEALLANRQRLSQSTPDSGHDRYQRSRRPEKRPVSESTGGIFCIGDNRKRLPPTAKKCNTRRDVSSLLTSGDVGCLDRPLVGRFSPRPSGQAPRQEKSNTHSTKQDNQQRTAWFGQNDRLKSGDEYPNNNMKSHTYNYERRTWPSG